MSTHQGVVLLACGSFNPITNMHMRLFEVARDSLHQSNRYDVIGGIMSPVNDKYEKAELIEASHRCKMVELALQSSDWISCDRWESTQDEWQETVQVLRYHQTALNKPHTENLNIPSKKKKQKFDEINVKLLCGADLLQSFSVPGLWNQNDILEIVSRFGMVVVTREGTNPLRFIYESDILTQYKEVKYNWYLYCDAANGRN